MKEKPTLFSLKNILVSFLIILSVTFCYYVFQSSSKIHSLSIRINNLETETNSLNSEISDLNSQLSIKDFTIQNQRAEIEQQKQEIQKLETELGITKSELAEAKPYQERVISGQNIMESYKLLSDYTDYTRPIILDYLELESPVTPSNDNYLWERGKQVYNWLSDNYAYCGDKGLRVGTTFSEFQFYSPDELLISSNNRCGDCDDFATLFAGLMYASGVPKNKVWVVCGKVSNGGHCWNSLVLDDKTYRIDGICSQKDELFGFLGFSLGIKKAYYTNTKTNVDCLSEYTPRMKMNPEGAYMLS
ncbi:hypothetical protein GOV04_05060 [Candidatus Woesearchaeota archaeon]|nr:hypothetical protein [Candidatus Woesearchaeota archaeon]